MFSDHLSAERGSWKLRAGGTLPVRLAREIDLKNTTFVENDVIFLKSSSSSQLPVANANQILTYELKACQFFSYNMFLALKWHNLDSILNG